MTKSNMLDGPLSPSQLRQRKIHNTARNATSDSESHVLKNKVLNFFMIKVFIMPKRVTFSNPGLIYCYFSIQKS